MPEQLYRKVGRRYVPLDEVEQAWREGRPLEGIWYVTNRPGSRSQTYLCALDELPLAMPLAQLEAHRDTACRAALAALKGRFMGKSGGIEHWIYPSAHDVVIAIFRAIAAEEAQRDG